jgi:hypothetical protein
VRGKYTLLLFNIATVAVVIIVFYECLMHLGYLPLLTNSISFDAKVYEIKKQDIHKVALLALGSSITLDNINSNIVAQAMPSYYNFSSWGLQINDIKAILNIYLQQYAPKCVMICSSIPDFRKAGNVAQYHKYLVTDSYIREHLPELFYVKNYNPLLEIWSRKKEYNKDTADILKFDRYGGVSRNILTADTLMKNWVNDFSFPNEFTQFQYKQLQALALQLKRQQVTLVFVQSPIQQSYIKLIKNPGGIYAHINTCRSIVQKGGGVFLNYNNPETFADSLFVDPFHLSAQGAKKLTLLVIRDMKLHKAIQDN